MAPFNYSRIDPNAPDQIYKWIEQKPLAVAVAWSSREKFFLFRGIFLHELNWERIIQYLKEKGELYRPNGWYTEETCTKQLKVIIIAQSPQVLKMKFSDTMKYIYNSLLTEYEQDLQRFIDLKTENCITLQNTMFQMKKENASKSEIDNLCIEVIRRDIEGQEYMKQLQKRQNIVLTSKNLDLELSKEMTHTNESPRYSMFIVDNDEQISINGRNKKLTDSEPQSVLIKVIYPDNSSNIVKLNLNSQLITDNINEATEFKTNSQNPQINVNKMVGSGEEKTEKNILDFSIKHNEQYTTQKNNTQHKIIKKSFKSKLPIVKRVEMTQFENEIIPRFTKKNKSDVEEITVIKIGEAMKLHGGEIKEFKMLKIIENKQIKNTIVPAEDQRAEEILVEIEQKSNNKKKKEAESAKIINEREATKTQDEEIKKSKLSNNKTDEHSKKLLLDDKNQGIGNFKEEIMQRLNKEQEAEVGKITNKKDTTKTQDAELKTFETPIIKENEHSKKNTKLIKDQETYNLKNKITQLNKKNIEAATILKKREATQTQDVELKTFRTPEIKNNEKSKNAMILVKEHKVKSFEDAITQVFNKKKEKKSQAIKIINKIDATKTQNVELTQFKVTKVKDYEQSKKNMKMIKNQEIDEHKNEIKEKLKIRDAEVGTILKKGVIPKTQDLEVKTFKLPKIKNYEKSKKIMIRVKNQEEKANNDKIMQSLKKKAEKDVEAVKIIKKEKPKKMQDLDLKQFETSEIKTDEQSKNTMIIFKNQKEEQTKNEKMQKTKKNDEKNVEKAKIIKKSKATKTKDVAFENFKPFTIKKQNKLKKKVIDVKDQIINKFTNEMKQNLKKHKVKDFKVAKEINTIKPSRSPDNTLKKCEILRIQNEQSIKTMILIKNEEEKKIEDEIMQRSKKKVENDAKKSKMVKKDEIKKNQDMKLIKIKTPEMKKDGQLIKTMCDKNQDLEEFKNGVLQTLIKKQEENGEIIKILKEVKATELQDMKFKIFKMLENKNHEQSNTISLIDKQQEIKQLKNEIMQRLQRKKGKNVDAPNTEKREATRSHNIKRKNISITEIKEDKQLKKTIEIGKDQEIEEFQNEMTEKLTKEKDAEVVKDIKKKEDTITYDVELKKLKQLKIKSDNQSKNCTTPVANQDIEECTNGLVQILKENNAGVTKIAKKEEAIKPQDVTFKKRKMPEIEKDKQSKRSTSLIKDKELETSKGELMQNKEIEGKCDEAAKTLEKGKATKTQYVELKTFKTPEIKDKQSKNTMIQVEDQDIEECTENVMQILKQNNAEVNKIINQEEAIKPIDVEFEKLKTPEIKEDEPSKKTIAFVKGQKTKVFKTEIMQNLKKKDVAETKTPKNVKVTKTQNDVLIKFKSPEEKETNVEVGKVIKKGDANKLQDVELKKSKTIENKKDEKSQNTIASIKNQEIESFENKIIQYLKEKDETDTEINKIMKNVDKLQDVEFKKCKTHEINEDERSNNKMDLFIDQKIGSFKNDIMQNLKETNVEVGEIMKNGDANKLQDILLKKLKSPEIKEDELSNNSTILEKDREIVEYANYLIPVLDENNVEVTQIIKKGESIKPQYEQLKKCKTPKIEEDDQSKKSKSLLKDKGVEVSKGEIMKKKEIERKYDEAAETLEKEEAIKTQCVEWKTLEIKDDEQSNNTMIQIENIEECTENFVQLLKEYNTEINKIINQAEAIKPIDVELEKLKTPEIKKDESSKKTIAFVEGQEVEAFKGEILISKKREGKAVDAPETIKKGNATITHETEVFNIPKISENEQSNNTKVTKRDQETEEFKMRRNTILKSMYDNFNNEQEKTMDLIEFEESMKVRQFQFTETNNTVETNKQTKQVNIKETDFIPLKDLRKNSSESFGEFNQIEVVETKALSCYNSNEQCESFIIPKVSPGTDTRIATSLDFEVSTSSDLQHSIDLSKTESPSKMLSDEQKLTVTVVMLNANNVTSSNDEGDQRTDISINKSEIDATNDEHILSEGVDFNEKSDKPALKKRRRRRRIYTLNLKNSKSVIDKFIQRKKLNIIGTSNEPGPSKPVNPSKVKCRIHTPEFQQSNNVIDKHIQRKKINLNKKSDEPAPKKRGRKRRIDAPEHQQSNSAIAKCIQQENFNEKSNEQTPKKRGRKRQVDLQKFNSAIGKYTHQRKFSVNEKLSILASRKLGRKRRKLQLSNSVIDNNALQKKLNVNEKSNILTPRKLGRKRRTELEQSNSAIDKDIQRKEINANEKSDKPATKKRVRKREVELLQSNSAYFSVIDEDIQRKEINANEKSDKPATKKRVRKREVELLQSNSAYFSVIDKDIQRKKINANEKSDKPATKKRVRKREVELLQSNSAYFSVIDEDIQRKEINTNEKSDKPATIKPRRKRRIDTLILQQSNSAGKKYRLRKKINVNKKLDMQAPKKPGQKRRIVSLLQPSNSAVKKYRLWKKINVNKKSEKQAPKKPGQKRRVDTPVLQPSNSDKSNEHNTDTSEPNSLSNNEFDDVAVKIRKRRKKWQDDMYVYT